MPTSPSCPWVEKATMTRSVACRSCGTQMVFLTTANKKLIPVDAATVKDGETDFDPKVHTTHFATCPQAAQHRRRDK